jgi:hypothetical protein
LSEVSLSYAVRRGLSIAFMSQIHRARYPFCHHPAPAPTALWTDAFVQRPLRAADVDGDDAAVMASQGAVHQGSGGE